MRIEKKVIRRIRDMICLTSAEKVLYNNGTTKGAKLMEKSVVIELLKAIGKGSFVGITYESEKKLAKKFEGNTLIKKSVMTLRNGIEYENLASVKAMREAGVEAQGLNGMEWEDYPYILKNANGKLYARFYTVEGSHSKATWYLNGIEKTVDELLAMGISNSTLGLNGNGQHRDMPTTLNLSIEGITEIRAK